MTVPRPHPTNHPMREILQRGHEVPKSVEHLLNDAHKRGVPVKIVFPEDGHPETGAKDCFTLVYGTEPHFTCKPNLRAFRKALNQFNQVHEQDTQSIDLDLTPKEMKKLQPFGAKLIKGACRVHNDGGQLHLSSMTDGHVLAVPQTSQGKVPRAVLRAIIGMHDADAARERAREQLHGLRSGEITPFLGEQGRFKQYHFDENTVQHNPLVRLFNGKDYAVMMHYGDAFRIIQGAYPSRANLVEFFPEATKKNTDEPLFTTKFRLKALAADLKAHNGRTKSDVRIDVTQEQMDALRKKDAELEIGNYVLRHKDGMLHVHEKPR